MGTTLYVFLLSALAATGPTTQPAAENVWPDGTYGSMSLRSQDCGVQGQPTIIRAANRGKAVIKADTTCGIFANDGYYIHDLVLDGFDISMAPYDGIHFNGAVRLVIRNCRVHDNSNHGIALYACSDGTVDHCVVESNGSLTSDPTQRHGIYCNGNRMTITNNVVRKNSGYGIHVWPYGNAFTISQNYVYNQPYGAGIIVGRTDTNPANANTISSNKISGCRIGVQISNAYMDKISNNTMLGNAYGVDLYYPALGPVYVDSNMSDADISDPAKQAVVTTPGWTVSTSSWPLY